MAEKVLGDAPYYELGSRVLLIRAINTQLATTTCTWQNVDDEDLWPDELKSACVALWNAGRSG